MCYTMYGYGIFYKFNNVHGYMRTIQCRQVRLLSNWKYFLVLGLHVLSAIAFAFARCHSICVGLTRNMQMCKWVLLNMCLYALDFSLVAITTQFYVIAASSSSVNCSNKVNSFVQRSPLQLDCKERYPRVRRLLIRKWWQREYDRWRARREHGKTQEENLI